MKINHLFMRVMVWNMKWMTRYLNFIARPIVKLVATNEVIACGLRSETGQVNIIYSPTTKQNSHQFFKKDKSHWTEVHYNHAQNFSENLVHQKTLPSANINESYKIKTKLKSGRILSSPKITIKAVTKRHDDILNIKMLADGQAKISWSMDKTCNPMIHFLIIEDENNQSICGIYTRDTHFIYPKVKTASLAIGNKSPDLLKKGQKYSIKLAIVDYDGWVPCLAKKSFIYN